MDRSQRRVRSGIPTLKLAKQALQQASPQRTVLLNPLGPPLVQVDANTLARFGITVQEVANPITRR